MATLLLLINLAACGVIWAAAMFFYLRHDSPGCARQHLSQIALIFIAVGAFAGGVTTFKGGAVAWWVVMFRLGAAMAAGRMVLDTRRGGRS